MIQLNQKRSRQLQQNDSESAVEIYRGAEAVIYRNADVLIKHRISKSYRNESLDLDLRKKRTRKEAKALSEAAKIIKVPRIISVNEDDMKISMEFIDGIMVRKVLDDFSEKQVKEICNCIGRNIALLHNNSIIHGDLTTSNFLIKNYGGEITGEIIRESIENELYFIDFGLSFTSDSVEDKAVDLHLLRQALESKHYGIFDAAMQSVFEGYEKESKNYEDVFRRYKEVEKRGRNKAKMGG